jgi:hypothetical protein
MRGIARSRYRGPYRERGIYTHIEREREREKHIYIERHIYEEVIARSRNKAPYIYRHMYIYIYI